MPTQTQFPLSGASLSGIYHAQDLSHLFSELIGHVFVIMLPPFVIKFITLAITSWGTKCGKAQAQGKTPEQLPSLSVWLCYKLMLYQL